MEVNNEMQWILDINADTKVAYVLALAEKVINKIDHKEGFMQAEKQLICVGNG